MATYVRSHVISLTVCLILAASGVGLIVAALLTNGAEHGRLTQCFSAERMDLVVLPAGFPAVLGVEQLRQGALAKLRDVPGVDTVREVLGGTVHLFDSPRKGMHALVLPDTGLPMLPLVKGALPATSSEIVMHDETAERLDVQIGDTVTFTDAKGTPASLRISGLIGVDMDGRLIDRGTIGMSVQTAAQLVAPTQIQGLQLTLDAATSATEVRNRVGEVLGEEYSVLTRQDIAARRSVDAQVMTVTLAVLGLTCIIAAVVVSCGTYGRVHESYLRPAKDVLAEHGRSTMRKMLVFDRVVGVTISAASGITMAAGLLILLASMGADLPCMSVTSMTGIMGIIPLAAYVFAMSTAPLRAR